jgi:hypothetical protein
MRAPGASASRRTRARPGRSWCPGCSTAPAGPRSMRSHRITWVETGMAPETIVGTKLVNDTPPAVQMTRPFSVFPKVAKNRGSAAPALRRIVADAQDFNQTLAPKYVPRGVRRRSARGNRMVIAIQNCAPNSARGRSRPWRVCHADGVVEWNRCMSPLL